LVSRIAENRQSQNGQTFLGICDVESVENPVRRGALGGDAPDRSDQSMEFAGRNLFAEFCSRRL